MSETDKKFDQVLELLTRLFNKPHDKPSPETKNALSEISKKQNEIELKIQKFDVVDEKIDNIAKTMKDFIQSCEEKENKFVTKEVFEAKIKGLDRALMIYVSIGSLVVGVAINFVMGKL